MLPRRHTLIKNYLLICDIIPFLLLRLYGDKSNLCYGTSILFDNPIIQSTGGAKTRKTIPKNGINIGTFCHCYSVTVFESINNRKQTN